MGRPKAVPANLKVSVPRTPPHGEASDPSDSESENLLGVFFFFSLFFSLPLFLFLFLFFPSFNLSLEFCLPPPLGQSWDLPILSLVSAVLGSGHLSHPA